MLTADKNYEGKYIVYQALSKQRLAYFASSSLSQDFFCHLFAKEFTTCWPQTTVCETFVDKYNNKRRVRQPGRE